MSTTVVFIKPASSVQSRHTFDVINVLSYKNEQKIPSCSISPVSLFAQFWNDSDTMDSSGEQRKRNGFMNFLDEYWALLIKMLILTKRKPAQTIVEILLAYAFFALLLGMRSFLDRTHFPVEETPRFDPLPPNSTRVLHQISFSPSKSFVFCITWMWYFHFGTQTIHVQGQSFVLRLIIFGQRFRVSQCMVYNRHLSIESKPECFLADATSYRTVSLLPNTTFQSIHANIDFYTLNACKNSSSMGNDIRYYLRMPE